MALCVLLPDPPSPPRESSLSATRGMMPSRRVRCIARWLGRGQLRRITIPRTRVNSLVIGYRLLGLGGGLDALDHRDPMTRNQRVSRGVMEVLASQTTPWGELVARVVEYDDSVGI